MRVAEQRTLYYALHVYMKSIEGWRAGHWRQGGALTQLPRPRKSPWRSASWTSRRVVHPRAVPAGGLRLRQAQARRRRYGHDQRRSGPYAAVRGPAANAEVRWTVSRPTLQAATLTRSIAGRPVRRASRPPRSCHPIRRRRSGPPRQDHATQWRRRPAGKHGCRRRQTLFSGAGVRTGTRTSEAPGAASCARERAGQCVGRRSMAGPFLPHANRRLRTPAVRGGTPPETTTGRVRERPARWRPVSDHEDADEVAPDRNTREGKRPGMPMLLPDSTNRLAPGRHAPAGAPVKIALPHSLACAALGALLVGTAPTATGASAQPYPATHTAPAAYPDPFLPNLKTAGSGGPAAPPCR